ncbi:MAG: hypothetical protein HOP28_18215, partial [Gemmatimonadales bacterium]|nr:hypothetical protein [Gemmatimonadales bacterium]
GRAAPICRISGMQAGPDCPTSTEWFLPGTSAGERCTWHREGALALPAAFQEWAAGIRVAAAAGERSPSRAAGDSVRAGFRITSPAMGDRFRFVPGVDHRYATIALRAAGAPAAEAVVWSVDGRPVVGGRLPLTPGRHRIRAVAGTRSDEVVVEVVGPFPEGRRR